jgi:hypothetical protein
MKILNNLIPYEKIEIIEERTKKKKECTKNKLNQSSNLM